MKLKWKREKIESIKLYRQGDVLLKQLLLLLPNDKKDMVKLKELNTTIVREGERTGHHHKFETGQVQLFEDDYHTKYVKVSQQTTLTHQEHKPLVIDEGKYVVIIEREYDLFKAMAKESLKPPVRQIYD